VHRPFVSILIERLRRYLSLAAVHALIGCAIGSAYASNADGAACKPLERPNFVHVPMRLAVVARASDLGTGDELSKEVAYVNESQSYYQLTLLPATDALSLVENAVSKYDAVLVFDNEMMLDGSPKYNRHLFTYRDQNLSDETMIIDFRFDKAHRVVFAFLQIAATNTTARSLLLEIGLMALADINLGLDEDFLHYYRKVDHISSYKSDQISPATVQEVLEAREQIIVACFLRGN